jgi:murein hydrolase activator
MKKGRLFLMGGVALVLSTSLWAAGTEPVEKDLTQRRKDLKQIKKEISLTKEKEKKIQGKEFSVLGSLNRIETEIYRKEKELKQLESGLTKTRERLHLARNQIARLNKGMERTQDDLFSRVVALYKTGKTPPGAFLLTSHSYPDLLKIEKCLRVILDYDARLVETYRYQVTLKEKYKDELTQDQSQRERSISEVEVKKGEIERVRATKRALLKSIRNEKVVYKKFIGELEERAKQLQVLVAKLEKEKSLLAHRSQKVAVSRGKVIPPVQGKVISFFKEKGQNGIEIRAPLGAEIRAVLPGKVLYADWFKGFGNLVIIDHGDHTFTVSGYASELLKKAGETVSQGEAVALVGSAGSLKGPCLYFEIRRQGKPQDPMNWLPNLDKVVFLPHEKEALPGRSRGAVRQSSRR